MDTGKTLRMHMFIAYTVWQIKVAEDNAYPFPFKLAQYLSYLLNKASSTPYNENKIQKRHCDQGQSRMMINDSLSVIMQN